MVKLLFILLVIVTITSCVSNPGIVQVSPDTYLISRVDRAGMFGNASKMKADVIQEANKFAKTQGKTAIPVSIEEIPAAVGRFASIDYQFRIVSEEDEENKRTDLARQADIILESNNQSPVNKNKDDLYEQLLKLDDLRKKGIITEKEFQAQKEKLLSR